MDPVIGSILAEQAKWLVWRCRRIAIKVVTDWKSLEAVTAEVNQAVLDRFVRRAHEGWFAEVPSVSREAQVRNLLGFCLRQEEKARFAQLAKDRRTTSVQHDAEEDTYLDVVETLPDSTVESAPDALERQEHMKGLLRAIPRLSHPVRKLVVVSLFRPTDLQSEDIAAAARHSAGGNGSSGANRKRLGSCSRSPESIPMPRMQHGGGGGSPRSSGSPLRSGNQIRIRYCWQ